MEKEHDIEKLKLAVISLIDQSKSRLETVFSYIENHPDLLKDPVLQDDFKKLDLLFEQIWNDHDDTWRQI